LTQARNQSCLCTAASLQVANVCQNTADHTGMDIECDSPYSMHCRRDYLNRLYIYSVIRNFDLQAYSLICMVRVGGQNG